MFVLKSEVGRVARWRLFLQEFDFVVEHVPGKSNVIADGLSRCLVILDDAKQKIEKVHNAVMGHGGVSKTMQLLKEHDLQWKSMRSDVVEYVRNCPVCQKSRVTAVDDRAVEAHVIESYEPFQEVSLDSVVNLPEDSTGNKVILVVIDNFTRYVELFAVKDVSASTAAQCLLSVSCRYGPVSIIRSDNGSQFVSEVFSKLVELMGSRQLLTVGFKPSANGICERVNAEVVRHLSAIVRCSGIQDRWSMGLPLVQRILNTSVHSSTGFSPVKLLFGDAIDLDRGLVSPPPGVRMVDYPSYVRDLCEFQKLAIAASQVHQASLNDRRVMNPGVTEDQEKKSFEVGEYVLAKRFVAEKLDFKWRGPFRVVAVNANVLICGLVNL